MKINHFSKWFAALAISLFGAEFALANCTNTDPGQTGGDLTSHVTCAEAQAGIQVYIGGASAPDNSFNAGLVLASASGGIFIDGTIRQFEGEEGAGGDDSTITCGEITASAASDITTGTLTAGDVVCIHKTAHGSGTGNGPLRDSTLVDFLDITRMGISAGPDPASCVASTELVPPGATTAIERHTGCGGDVTPAADTLIAQHAGASDVEPFPFFAGLAPSDLETQSVLSLPWQIQVTLPMYLGLQAVQYVGVANCDPNLGTYDATGDDSSADGVSNAPECVPSLTEGQVRSIMAGTLTSVSELVAPDGERLDAASEIASITTPYAASTVGEADGGSLSTILPAVIAGESARQIWLCRRRVGSGTEASFENVFLRQRCETSGVTMRLQSYSTSHIFLPSTDPDQGDGDTVDPTAEPNSTVFGGTGSSDVLECLERVANAGVWGIGINSTEKVYTEESLDRNNWRTVKVDYILPSSRNVTKGKYDKFSEVVCNTRPGEDTSIFEVEIARDLVCDRAASGAAISLILPDFEHEWGQGGPMGIQGLGTNFLEEALFDSTGAGGPGLNETELAADPINAYTKSPAGSTINCAVPVKAPSLVPGAALGSFPAPFTGQEQVVTPIEPPGAPYDTP